MVKNSNYDDVFCWCLSCWFLGGLSIVFRWSLVSWWPSDGVSVVS